MGLTGLRPTDGGKLLNAANFLVIVFMIIGLLFRFFAIGLHDPPWVALVILATAVGNSLYLFRDGSQFIASWVLVGLLLFGIVFAGFRSGGFAGPIVLVAPIIPVFAIVLLDTKTGWFILVVMVFILSGFLAGQLNGQIPPTPYGEEGDLVGRYLAILISTIIGTWVTWSYAETKRELLASNEFIANTDHLTGIPNRRAVMERLILEANRARRSGNSLSVMMADVDHFKRYNDVNGHPAGDACLRIIAEALVEGARRPTDLVGRYGGEEFIAILPDTDTEGAIASAERMRLAIESKAIPYESGKDEKVSMTFGVATARGQDIDTDALLQEADQALYRGKDQGRNRVVCYGS